MSIWKRMFRKGAPSAPSQAQPAPGLAPGRVYAPDEAFVAAIESAFARAYGAQLPFLYGVNVAFAEGGPDPLDAVRIYWNEDGPHWHYVSHGLAPFGFELTFRLRAAPEDVGTDPATHLGAIAYNAPFWPVKLLNMLARRVHRTGRPYLHGEWWQGPPGVVRPYAEFEYLVFTTDPDFGVVEHPGCAVCFVQAAGVDASVVDDIKKDELEGRGHATIEKLLARNPRLVTAGATR